MANLMPISHRSIASAREARETAQACRVLATHAVTDAKGSPRMAWTDPVELAEMLAAQKA